MGVGQRKHGPREEEEKESVFFPCLDSLTMSPMSDHSTDVEDRWRDGQMEKKGRAVLRSRRTTRLSFKKRQEGEQTMPFFFLTALLALFS